MRGPTEIMSMPGMFRPISAGSGHDLPPPPVTHKADSFDEARGRPAVGPSCRAADLGGLGADGLLYI
jgi:hypothetical protein